MNVTSLIRARTVAVQAAHAAGRLMRRHRGGPLRVNEASRHDLKLELDVRCQRVIERTLRRSFANVAILGEEGCIGDPSAEWRWVVDPIDGTVNFAHDIPHACVSIALQRRTGSGEDDYATKVGVILDPFVGELWTAIAGRAALLNGRPIRVSERVRLAESIVTIGFAKSAETIERTLPAFGEILRRVRKIRLMGAAALALTYVASGRFDAYVESGIRLWDIAAGGLILECAGGEFRPEPIPGKPHAYRLVATNGRITRTLGRVIRNANRAAGGSGTVG